VVEQNKDSKQSRYTDKGEYVAPIETKRVFNIFYGKEFMFCVAAEFILYNGGTIILKNRNDHFVAVLTEGYGVVEEGNLIK